MLTTVQLLSGYTFLTPYYQDYGRRLWERFASFRDHRAVRFFRALSADGHWSDAYPTAMLYLSAPPALEETPLPPHLYAAFNGADNFRAFVAALRSFAHQTRFARFFREEERHYRHLEEQVRQLLGDRDPAATLEAYYGMRQLSYHLVLSPLLHHGGFGPHIGRGGGPYEVYVLLGPTGAERGHPTYGPLPHLLELLWHEFSHAFVNDLAAGHARELAQYAELYLPIAEPMQELGYRRWLDCANEHVIRAITARLSSQVFGPEEGRRALLRESRRGFRYVHALARRLREYEENRQIYPDLAAFYPRLLSVFAELDQARD